MKMNSSCKVRNGAGHGLDRYVGVEKFITEICQLLDVLIHISELQFNLHCQYMDKGYRDGKRKGHGDFVPLAMQIAKVFNAALDIVGPL